jgi:hypothetical protein
VSYIVDMVVRPYFTEEKQVLPFDKLIELEKIDDWTFRSIVKAYSPTGKRYSRGLSTIATDSIEAERMAPMEAMSSRRLLGRLP